MFCIILYIGIVKRRIIFSGKYLRTLMYALSHIHLPIEIHCEYKKKKQNFYKKLFSRVQCVGNIQNKRKLNNVIYGHQKT